MRIAGIRFRKKDKICLSVYDETKLILSVNNMIVVALKPNSLDIGVVVKIFDEETSNNVLKNNKKNALADVVRIADENDFKQKEYVDSLLDEALTKCNQQVKKHSLPMFLVDAHYTLDKTKITFYFTAEGRVDFRNLVKDLAYIFKTRIELFQIGVRDECKKIGGIGICGRECCCSYFLYDFTPVTIKMAKTQNLNLTPTKISGVCGRLLCCLSYEQDFYKEEFKNYPAINCTFSFEGNKGRVFGVNILKKTVSFSVNNSFNKEMNITEFMKSYGKKLVYCKNENDRNYQIEKELKILEGE